MSKLFICTVAGFAALCGALIGVQAMSAHLTSEAALAACQPTDLVRAGQLFRFRSQDAWISSRGDVFHISRCPLLRDVLVARVS
jgi:hypothetical protein